jgi:hypothetical protein
MILWLLQGLSIRKTLLPQASNLHRGNGYMYCLTSCIHLTQLELRFRLGWWWWTKEMHGHCHRGWDDTTSGNLFFLFHLIGVYIKDSYSVEFLSYLYLNNNEIGRSYIQENETLINSVRWPSSRLWTRKKAIEFGSRLDRDFFFWFILVFAWWPSPLHPLHGFMLEEEIAASFWGFGFNIQNAGKCKGEGREGKIIRSIFIH